MLWSSAIFGLLVGSFLNVLIYRLSVVSPSPLFSRSFCPRCRHPLSWPDMVPIVSFFWLGRRCRYCQKSIAWHYPAVELTTAGLFTLLVYLGKFDLPGVIFISSLIVVFFSDLIYGLIPDEATGAITIAAIFNYSLSITNLTTGFGAMAVFLLIYLITNRQGLGFGDVKLVGALGFFLGWPRAFWADYLAVILGGAAGLFLLILRRKKMGMTIPLGPFLVIGGLVSWLYGLHFS